MFKQIRGKKAFLAVTGATALIAAAVGIFSDAAVQAKSEKDLFVIKTWTRKDCSVTPWTVADRLGFLAEEGVKLQCTGETQPAIQIPSILRGNNDVGTFHPNTIAVAKSGGAQVTGVLQGGVEPTDRRARKSSVHVVVREPDKIHGRALHLKRFRQIKIGHYQEHLRDVEQPRASTASRDSSSGIKRTSAIQPRKGD